ncbi:hypothetical protein JR316_0009032 [Psilocybe cubensis]|uniref:Uncharacterized protein n=2 Tax=Psilocybe cubensis TaxID=181762 RepID=A0A8H8CKM7_PSICU|nr:hypothetical protein JR316_0009032 [Psilocybe cubensis]KAH9478575.1 hypothetical protein JR316_0009032 [Psilocybe cubensis]
MCLSLWKDRFRAMCLENTVLPTTYSVDTMHLKDFEHATASPSTFLNNLLRSHGSGGPLKTFGRHCIDLWNLHQRVPDLEEVTQLYLIPGGRFLLSEHRVSINVPTVMLWDLGTPGMYKDLSQCYPIAILDEAPFGGPHPCHLTPDNQGILFLSYSDAWHIDNRWWVLYS